MPFAYVPCKFKQTISVGMYLVDRVPGEAGDDTFLGQRAAESPQLHQVRGLDDD